MTARFPSLAPAVRLADQVADALAAEVREGRFGEGDRLPTEAVLAAQFGVSRTVVREAVSRLKSLGLVDSRQGSGVYVRAAGVEPLRFEMPHMASREAVIQMAELRRALEAEVAALAAERRSPDDLRRIREAIDALQAVPSPTPVAVDLGTGSGAIALALATEVPHARVWAVENSPRAFIWARENVRAVGADNLELVFVDMAEALPGLDGTLDLVVSNPPYIPDDAIPRDPEVRLHDPAAALYGGPDGLDVVRALSHRALALLRPGGTLVIEHGELQGAELRALLDADGWRAPATHRDLLGRDRATTALR